MAETKIDQNGRETGEESEIPTLTDMVALEPSEQLEENVLNEEALEQLRSNLTTLTVDLASTLLHGALREMEAALLEHVLDRLRQELPELVDRVISEQLADAADRAAGHGRDE